LQRLDEKYGHPEPQEGGSGFGESTPDAQKEKSDSWEGIYQGISKLYRDCTFESFQGKDELAAAVRFKAQAGKDLVLHGVTGCGKTHLAIAALKEFKGGKRFMTAPDLLLEIRSAFNGGEESEDEIIRKCAEYPLLVLDDLGAEKSTEYSITTLYIIIDRRIRDCKQTIITTNLTLAQIEETLGARIASRLAGMENVTIKMPDYRKKRNG
jgi:DNA replication protein DnaC